MGNTLMTVNINADTTSGLQLESDTSGEIDLQTNGTTKVHMDSSGNVGIGTSSPSAKLQVVGNTNTDVALIGTAGTRLTIQPNDAIGEVKFKVEDPSGNNYSKFMSFHTEGGSGTTERMRIDSSGRVTIASIPSFLAYFGTSSDVTISSGSDYVFDDTKYNVGSHYNTSNGRFTAPVAGLYEFNFSAYYTNSASSTARMQTAWKINGSEYSGTDAIGLLLRDPNSCGGVITGEQTVVFDLSANDYVTVFARNLNRVYRGHCMFSGRLIG